MGCVDDEVCVWAVVRSRRPQQKDGDMAAQKERMLDIVLTRNVAIEGKHMEAGSKVRVTENLARYLV